MNNAVIVIARGGSKRLPRKNVRPFCGLPLVAWTLIQANSAHKVDHVFLSTDDDEIEAIGHEYGVTVIRRPDWPDADVLSANRPYQHALQWIEENMTLPVRFACAFPTSPLRKPDDFDKGFAAHEKICSVHVWPAARRRETAIYRDVCGVYASLEIWDKEYNYVEGNSGMYNIQYTNWYKWFVPLMTEWRGGEGKGDHDKWLDEAMHRPMNQVRWVHPDLDSYYVECEPWQLSETDTLPEFEFTEVLMKHYILKGRGPEVYHEYARGKE